MPPLLPYTDRAVTFSAGQPLRRRLHWRTRWTRRARGISDYPVILHIFTATPKRLPQSCVKLACSLLLDAVDPPVREDLVTPIRSQLPFDEFSDQLPYHLRRRDVGFCAQALEGGFLVGIDQQGQTSGSILKIAKCHIWLPSS